MSDTDLTPLEREALDFLLAGDDPVLATLREQAAGVTVKSREWTGCVFLTDLVVPDSTPRLTSPSHLQICDVYGTLDTVDCGFVLFVESGTMVLLDCPSWHDNPVALNAKLRELRYVKQYAPKIELAERDMEGLRRDLEARRKGTGRYGRS